MANENTKVKDNTDEIMKGEKMVNIMFSPRQLLGRIMMIILIAFWILSIAKPNIFKDMVNKAKEETRAETTTSKEIEMIEKTGKYVALFSDGTYVTADDLSEFATKLSEETGKTYASEDSKLKVIDGGAIMTVEITEYRR